MKTPPFQMTSLTGKSGYLAVWKAFVRDSMQNILILVVEDVHTVNGLKVERLGMPIIYFLAHKIDFMVQCP